MGSTTPATTVSTVTVRYREWPCDQFARLARHPPASPATQSRATEHRVAEQSGDSDSKTQQSVTE